MQTVSLWTLGMQWSSSSRCDTGRPVQDLLNILTQVWRKPVIATVVEIIRLF